MISSPSSALHSPSSPVEVPLPCEHTPAHAPTSAPEFEPDCPSREFPLSSFDPASDLRPPTSSAPDYDSIIAELKRLEAKCHRLKMLIDLRSPTSAK